jgi:hypothetical protein
LWINGKNWANSAHAVKEENPSDQPTQGPNKEAVSEPPVPPPPPNTEREIPEQPERPCQSSLTPAQLEEPAWHKFVGLGGLSISAVTLIVVAYAACVYRGQLIEMQNSTGAANRAISVAQDTARRQLRAYIAITLVTVDSPAASKTLNGRLTVHLKNVGQTPAHDIVSKLGSWRIDSRLSDAIQGVPDRVFNDELTHNKTSSKEGPPSKDYLEPGQEKIAQIVFDDACKPFDPEYAKNNVIYFYGDTDYWDIYGAHHRREFCMLYGFGDPPELLTAESHNTEYDIKQE